MEGWCGGGEGESIGASINLITHLFLVGGADNFEELGSLGKFNGYVHMQPLTLFGSFHTHTLSSTHCTNFSNNNKIFSNSWGWGGESQFPVSPPLCETLVCKYINIDEYMSCNCY